MKALITTLIVVSTTAFAQIEKSPTEMWDISNNRNNTVSVTVNPVDDVGKVCEQQSHARGHGGFGQRVSACTFWDRGITGYSCTIYVGKKTNNDIVGHEFRHCIQGAFH